MKFLSDILAKAGLVVDGTVTLNSVANATTDTDRFIVVESGVVKYRTGTQLLSDIGGISGNQTITLSGDATGSGTTSIAVTLANSGVVAGTYGSSTAVPVITVDAKGRVTGVTTASISGSLTFTGDVTGSGTTGSTTTLTLANSGVTTGTYTKVTVDAKGRVTTGTTLSAGDIPSLNYLPISGGTLTGNLIIWPGTNASYGAGLKFRNDGYAHYTVGVKGNTFVLSNTGADGSVVWSASITDLITVTSAGNVTTLGSVTASSIIKSGGTSSQFLKADGSIDSTTYQSTSQKGQANGYASLDGAGKVPVSQLPSSIMEYKGTWNASTNSPTLADGTGDTGDVYRVSTAGTRNLGSGSITFDIGDYVIYNGTVWEKSDTTDAVASVNGFTGIITLTTTNIGEGTNLYYTDTRARAALSFTAGSGGYNSTTGVITIPTNTNQLANGAGYITGYTETDTLASVTGRGASTSTNVTFNGIITANSSIVQGYGTILTGYNSGFQITVNATYSGGQTNTYTPQYAGVASAGMFVMKQRNGGEGIMDFYGKQSGTDGSTQAYSTFNHLMTMLPTGYVGVGTVAPGAKLDIVSTASGSEGLRVDGASGGFAFVVRGGSTYTSHIRAGLTIGANYFTTPPSNGAIIEGNVGIGTASSAYKLHVKSDTDVVQVIESTTNVTYTQYYNSNSGSGGSGDGLTIGLNTTNALVWYREAGDLLLGTNNTERVRITSTGNVGIGTVSPQTSLTLSRTNVSYAGQLQLASDNFAQITFYNSAAITPSAANRKASIIYNVAGNTFEIANQISGGHLILQGSDSGGGRVGINIDAPQAILDVSHTAGTTNIIRVSNGAGNYRWRVDQNFSMIMTNSVGTDTFSVTTGGVLTAVSLVKSGGTSSQFLMADGSVSTNPGWITSYTETDTLATVTSRGNTTTGRINVRSNGNQGGGNILMGNTGNGSNKWSYLTGTHYNQDTQTQGVSIIGAYSDINSNVVVIGGSIYEANPATEIQFWTHTATTHNLGGSKRMVIDTNGNVGINSPNPTYTLHVGGSGYFNSTLYVNGQTTLDDQVNITSGYSVNFGSSRLHSTDTSYFLGGNVGIAVSNPANKLQIGSVGSSGYGGNDLAIGNGTQVMAFFQSSTVSTWYTNTSFSLMPSGAGSTGNLGVGTTSPNYRLDVRGNIALGDTSTNPQIIFTGASVNGFTNGYISWNAGTNSTAALTLSVPGNNFEVVTGYNERVVLSTGNGLYVYTNNGSGTYTNRLTLDRTGNLTISGTLTEQSALRYKENIAPVTAALEKVDQLQPVSYNKKGSSTKEIGLIAEDVFDVYPEFVLCDDNGEPVGIHYSRLTAVLIESVKELKTRIQELEKRN
jgi:hypothetical protein